MNDLDLLFGLITSENFLAVLSWSFLLSGLAWLCMGYRMIHGVLASWIAGVMGGLLALWLCIRLKRYESCLRYLAAGVVSGAVLGLLFTRLTLYTSRGWNLGFLGLPRFHPREV